jgi:hypothetical protein
MIMCVPECECDKMTYIDKFNSGIVWSDHPPGYYCKYCNEWLGQLDGVKYPKHPLEKPEKINSYKNLGDKLKEPEINLIDKTIDLSKFELDKYDWDVDVNGNKYDLYRIPGFVHTISGKRGANDLWCCPHGETPTVDNLIEYNGASGCRWGFNVSDKHYIKNKWNETSVWKNVKCTITRNDEDFYTFFTRDIEYAIAKAQKLIVDLSEFPIPFHDRNWKDELIGRKIFYQRTPAIISDIIDGDLDILIHAEKGYKFPLPIWIIADQLSDDVTFDPQTEEELSFDIKNWKADGNETVIKDTIFSKHIWWFRS